jgi:hypothetical protein
VKRIAGAVVVSAATAAALLAPAGASASTQVDPVPQCVKVVVANAPGFATSTVGNLVNNGEPPRIMGPFLPC